MSKLKRFFYQPGDKWSCGNFEFSIDTPLGLFEWKEVVPGPRHGEDNKEITVTLNGTEIDLFDGSVAELDFEPPGKEGKWSQKFANSQNEITEQFWDWFYSEEKVLERIVACANPRDNLTEEEMRKNLRKMYFFHGFIVWYDTHGFFAQDADYIENEESFGDEEKGASSYDTFAELLYDITNQSDLT